MINIHPKHTRFSKGDLVVWCDERQAMGYAEGNPTPMRIRQVYPVPRYCTCGASEQHQPWCCMNNVQHAAHTQFLVIHLDGRERTFSGWWFKHP